LKFSTALANTVTAVAYAEFENVIEVDRDMNVVFDLEYEHGRDRSHPSTTMRERL